MEIGSDYSKVEKYKTDIQSQLFSLYTNNKQAKGRNRYFFIKGDTPDGK